METEHEIPEGFVEWDNGAKFYFWLGDDADSFDDSEADQRAFDFGDSKG